MRYLAILLLLMTGCSYNHPRNSKDIKDACDRVENNKRYAHQASEYVPSKDILGKTYDDGPVNWIKVLEEKE